MQAASCCGQEEPTVATVPFRLGTGHTHTHTKARARPFPASPLVNLRDCLQLRVGAPRMSDPELLMSGPLGEGTQLGTAENGVLVPLSSGSGLR